MSGSRISRSIRTNIQDPQFIFGDMMRWINQAFLHSRFIVDIFTRLGAVLLLQRFSLLTKVLIALLGFSVALISFIIRQHYSKQSSDNRHRLAEQDTFIHSHDKRYMNHLERSIKHSLDLERVFINTIGCFLDMNVFSTFLYIIINNFIPLSNSIILTVFSTSVVFSFLYHYHFLNAQFRKQDRQFADNIAALNKKSLVNDEITPAKINHTPTFLMLITESSTLTAFMILIMSYTPANFSKIALNYIFSFSYLALSIPVLASITLLYKSTSFRNKTLSFVSGLSTSSALIFMGYRYFIWFPVISEVFLFEIAGISLVKASCVFFGTLTGLIYYRASERLQNISNIYEAKKSRPNPTKSLDLAQKPPHLMLDISDTVKDEHLAQAAHPLSLN